MSKDLAALLMSRGVYFHEIAQIVYSLINSHCACQN